MDAAREHSAVDISDVIPELSYFGVSTAYTHGSLLPSLDPSKRFEVVIPLGCFLVRWSLEDPDHPQRLSSILAHDAVITAVSRKDDVIATASFEGSVKVWKQLGDQSIVFRGSTNAMGGTFYSSIHFLLWSGTTLVAVNYEGSLCAFRVLFSGEGANEMASIALDRQFKCTGRRPCIAIIPGQGSTKNDDVAESAESVLICSEIELDRSDKWQVNTMAADLYDIKTWERRRSLRWEGFSPRCVSVNERIRRICVCGGASTVILLDFDLKFISEIDVGLVGGALRTILWTEDNSLLVPIGDGRLRYLPVPETVYKNARTSESRDSLQMLSEVSMEFNEKRESKRPKMEARVQSVENLNPALADPGSIQHFDVRTVSNFVRELVCTGNRYCWSSNSFGLSVTELSREIVTRALSVPQTEKTPGDPGSERDEFSYPLTRQAVIQNERVSECIIEDGRTLLFHDLACCGLDWISSSQIAVGDLGGNVLGWDISCNSRPYNGHSIAGMVRSVRATPVSFIIDHTAVGRDGENDSDDDDDANTGMAVVGLMDGSVLALEFGLDGSEESHHSQKDPDLLMRCDGNVTDMDWLDGNLLAGCSSGRIHLRNVAGESTSFEAHSCEVWSISTGPGSSGPSLLCASEDSTTSVWDVSTLKRVNQLLGHGAAVTCTDWETTNVGQLVCTSSDDRTVRLYEPGSWNFIKELRTADLYVTYCALEPRGNRLACATEEGSVYFFDLRNSAVPLYRSHWHSGSVSGLRWGGDDAPGCIASCAGDCVLCVAHM